MYVLSLYVLALIKCSFQLYLSKRLEVCLFVLSRRVVDGYHTIFQVGTTVQIVAGSVVYG